MRIRESFALLLLQHAAFFASAITWSFEHILEINLFVEYGTNRFFFKTRCHSASDFHWLHLRGRIFPSLSLYTSSAAFGWADASRLLHLLQNLSQVIKSNKSLLWTIVKYFWELRGSDWVWKGWAAAVEVYSVWICACVNFFLILVKISFYYYFLIYYYFLLYIYCFIFSTPEI